MTAGGGLVALLWLRAPYFVLQKAPSKIVKLDHGLAFTGVKLVQRSAPRSPYRTS